MSETETNDTDLKTHTIGHELGVTKTYVSETRQTIDVNIVADGQQRVHGVPNPYEQRRVFVVVVFLLNNNIGFHVSLILWSSNRDGVSRETLEPLTLFGE